MKQLSDLNNYLDPSYAETLALSQQAKTEIILAEEALIRQTASSLEKLQDLTEYLGSEHIKVVPNIEMKLQELSKIHIQQQDDSCELSEEVKNLLTQYNSATTLLSKQFIQWDEAITRLEVSSLPRGQDD